MAVICLGVSVGLPCRAGESSCACSGAKAQNECGATNVTGAAGAAGGDRQRGNTGALQVLCY